MTYSKSKKGSAEKTVRDIRRATQRHYAAVPDTLSHFVAVRVRVL